MKTEMIIDNQIKNQIEGKTLVEVYTSNISLPDFISIYSQFGKYWIRPSCCSPEQIIQKLYDKIISLFTNEQEFNTDAEVIRYDQFFELIEGE